VYVQAYGRIVHISQLTHQYCNIFTIQVSEIIHTHTHTHIVLAYLYLYLVCSHTICMSIYFGAAKFSRDGDENVEGRTV